MKRRCPECRRFWYYPEVWDKPQPGVDAGVAEGGSHDFCEDCLGKLELEQATPEERSEYHEKGRA